jgi:HEPN domain-containing protein
LERLLDELVGRRSDLVPELEPLCALLADAYFSDRYPGFDLDDPDWPLLKRQLETITKVLTTVEDRIERKTR